MKEKDNSIELLRIFAIWAVILIHTTSASLDVSGYYLHNTPFTFFLNQSARFAVPLFFVISGYVLQLRYPDITGNIFSFYKKRFFRLAIPFIVWSFIYYAIVARAGVKAFFINAPSILLLGSGAEHLYFIPAIMLLYFLFPFLNKLLRIVSTKKYAYLYIFLLSLLIVPEFIDYYFNISYLATPLRIAFLNLPIFIIGMIYANNREIIKRLSTTNWTKFIIGIFLLSFLLINIEGYILSVNGFFLSYFMSQWRPSVFLYTLSIFTLGMLFLPKMKIKIPSNVASMTFFIFFIHVIFIHVFWRIWGAYLFSKSMGHIVEQIWFDPLVFLFVVICSYASAFIVSKIPIVKNMLGIM